VSTTSLLLHGAGSCPATVRALLGPACPPGSRVVAPALDGGTTDTVELIAALVVEAAAAGRPVGLVAGISLGAHAAARWAAASGAAVPLGLVMPAWTGPPGQVAAATLAAAQEVDRVGREQTLARIGTEHPGDWVVAELARGWRSRDEDALVRALRAAGTSTGPTEEELAAVTGPAAVLALAEDPLHPEAVARSWAGLLPQGALEVVARDAPATDRGVLGTAVRRLLARQVSGSR
jgi:pimeloyl-ACP methyl ester carboxylesterase